MRRPLVLVLTGALVAPQPLTEEPAAAMNSLPAATLQSLRQADTWDSLPDLPRGTRLQLLLTDGSEIRGRLVSARTDAIVLEKSWVRLSLRESLTFKRSDVSSVVQVRGWPTWAKALLWVGIGWAAAGAIIGSIVGNS